MIKFHTLRFIKITIILMFATFTLCITNSCREECYPNTERYFETHFIQNGKTIDPGYNIVYAPGGKGNIPLQETRYGEYFYCLPIPQGKDIVTYIFEKSGIKDSIQICYSRTTEYQSNECGKIMRYSNPEVLHTSFTKADVKIENEENADYDKFEITIHW